MRKVGFLGTGVMGGIIVKSIVKSGKVLPENIMICDIDETKMETLKEELGISYTCSSPELAASVDVLFLCVKPDQMKQSVQDIGSSLKKDVLIVSIAAGTSISTVKAAAGDNYKVIRIMPNTPALVGEGMTVMSSEAPVTQEDLDFVTGLLASFGKVEILEEKLMNEVVAVIGSSPAYVFMFIEAMADAAVLSGIPRKLAYSLAAQSVLGSAKMILESGKHPGELKDQVCSPAGTTIEAVYSLEKTGFRASVIEAMKQCTLKAREMSKEKS